MLFDLNRRDLDCVRPLFALLAPGQPACAAVLDGGYPGQVFADDPRRPRSALLVTSFSVRSLWCYLAGDPANSRFNQALNQALSTGKLVGQEVKTLFFICDPQDWGGEMPAVVAPLAPFTVQRRHYTCRRMAYDWQAKLSPEYRIARLDPAWLDRPDFQLPDEAREILARWRSLHGQIQDSGFAALHGDKIVSWTTIDFCSVSGQGAESRATGSGEAGVFTVAAHRRRGLAAATAAAAIAHGLGTGLSSVEWTCAEGNSGSIRTAERLGFERGADYQQYIVIVDQATNLAYQAYECLAEGDFEGAAALHEQCFALGSEPPSWAYFDAARARAALADLDGALSALQSAVQKGWSDVAALEACAEFAPLRGSEAWTALLAQISGA